MYVSGRAAYVDKRSRHLEIYSRVYHAKLQNFLFPRHHKSNPFDLTDSSESAFLFDPLLGRGRGAGI